MREARQVAALVDAPQLSIVIPLFNEEMNVEPLLAELFEVLRHQGRTFEVIAVDDASRDGTFAALAKIGRREPLLRVIRFRRNSGQTAALAAGIEASRGAVIVPLDGDLQNDPVDIERLLAKLEGQSPDGVPGGRYDVVSGWRKHRRDVEFGRKLPSKIANWLISRISGVRLHDYGLSAGCAARRPSLWRDAPIHSDLRILAGGAGYRDGGQPSRSASREVEVWAWKILEGSSGSVGGQISREFQYQADLPVWGIWADRVDFLAGEL
jgi:glycosyltransferase involved in cell wall biosynthesis